MSKELIRLVDFTIAFDDEVVLDNITLNIHDKEFLTPVSYTHLDVYKRQSIHSGNGSMPRV